MNRHERRAMKASQRCKSCNKPAAPLFESPVDHKLRCTRCHGQHVASAMAPEEGGATKRQLKAQQLQAALHKAILDVFPDKDADIALIVQCLGTTAATFATQRHAEAGDLPASSFVRGMETYVRQIYAALGIAHDLDDVAPEAPRIIAP